MSFLRFVETFEIIVDWALLVWRASARQSLADHSYIGLVPHVQPRYWLVCLHHRKHATGSHADRDDVQPAHVFFSQAFSFQFKPCQKFCNGFPMQFRFVTTWLSFARSCIKGVGIEAIQREVIALAIFGIVIMAAAALRFRKRLD